MKKSINKYIRIGIKTSAVTLSAFSIFVFLALFFVDSKIPNNVSLIEGKKLSFNTILPTTLSQKGKRIVAADKSKSSPVDFSDEVKLFGAIPIKNVNVNVVKEQYVVPGGETFGIKLYTDGVLIVGMKDVDSEKGAINPAEKAGIRIGDVIMAVDGKAVLTNAEVGDIFSKSGGKPINLSLKHNNVAYSATVSAVKSKSSGEYKAGLWVRDSTAGIGTITFYDPQTKVFGGLGHGICDVDTGKIMPLMSGDVVRANITGIQKGVKGQPGELKGTLEDINWGTLAQNTETGVFGNLNCTEVKNALPVAMCQDIQDGDAKILASIDSEGPKLYDVKIDRIHFNDTSPTKNMIIRVTDERLLKKTGGIVQGMSGSPIIQNGHLVGALTHVFVNEPERGYGIFAENMLKAAETVKAAS